MACAESSRALRAIRTASSSIRSFRRAHACGDRATSEHERAPAFDDDAVLKVRTDSACEHDALDVAADADELVGPHRVRDALHVLLDDRTFVELTRCVVRGCANELHSARMRLVVRLCALKRRQKA